MPDFFEVYREAMRRRRYICHRGHTPSKLTLLMETMRVYRKIADGR